MILKVKPESLKTIVMLKEYKTDNKEVNIVSFEEFKNTGDTDDSKNVPPTASGKMTSSSRINSF